MSKNEEKWSRGTHEGHERDTNARKMSENDVKFTIFTRKHVKNETGGHTRDTQGTREGQKRVKNSRNTCICLHFSPDSVDSFLFQMIRILVLHFTTLFVSKTRES